ncbi:carboxymuconolactone decarboxylase family protein [Silvimonas iriomotensis]|uniref:Alkyl hydroperoxide reductase AhpD n=1 Tax=Silvimonas iriomotensis TaxID=449662 RepID=A0ABQ2PDW7_9NEIS|nr:carboxymuconolactone decarboxylase family protein [Silvimonas iriomotensis]GGP23757.1 alkyl hydroperoxide reductase AhpD [Silvimonas iriomotensis]
MTSPRLPSRDLAPKAYAALAQVNAVLENSSLDRKFIELMFLRVSQINGCAYCVDLHWKSLVESGEDPRRLNSLITWRENTFYSEQERAALAWAESLTRLEQTGAPDTDFEPLSAHFTEQQIVELTFVVALMNAWNRLGVGMRLPVGLPRLKH